MWFKQVDSLFDALRVRSLRNGCREYLTNYQDPISVLQQIRWYFGYYRSATQASKYKLYLLYGDDGLPIGYGALQMHDRNIFVTECVAGVQRGKGLGAKILQFLIENATQEQELFAEIWEDNARSIALHERAGFTLHSGRIKNEKKLLTYRLPIKLDVDQGPPSVEVRVVDGKS